MKGQRYRPPPPKRAAPPPAARPRPLAIVIPGFLRGAGALAPFAKVLGAAGYDVALWNLPGHGGAPMLIGEHSVQRIAQELADPIATRFAGREVVLIGESLGGLVALQAAKTAPPNLSTVWAVDPPVTTAKLWPLRHSYDTFHRDLDYAQRWAIYGEVVFGLPSGAEREYRSLFRDLATPAHVLTGTSPLLPPRSTTDVPCLMGEDDRAMVAASPGFTLHVMEGDHLILNTAPERVAGLIAMTRAADLNSGR